ncbi:MAG: 7-carboxy-7-deazaguanine synthase QueE [Bacteroidota bacterium]|jgi:organic radical activating enzyme|nr:7-carboxy-7-deazaguanine synthase QueE [Bacteroidota bacterium]
MKKIDTDVTGRTLPLVEEFYSVQGEGCNTGRAAYFIRVGGCDVCCSWCDTKYSWNAELHPMVDIEAIAANVAAAGADSVVVTGGEPLMWNMGPLCDLLRSKGIETFLETSGAYPLTGTWDWITLSPKKNSPPLPDIWGMASELKVVIQDGTDFEEAERYSRKVGPGCRLLLQPEWSRYREMISEITEYVKRNTRWRVSLQAHKFMHIP